MKLTGFLAISSLVNAQNETVKQMSPRIINGVDAKIDNHPWLVSMWAPGVDSAPNHCGGAILHEEWILTATHCLFSQSQRPSNLVDVDLFRTVFAGDSVMIGMTKQSDAIGQAAQNGIFEKEIVSAHCHPEFEVSANNVLLNDICLLRIKAIGEAEFGSFGYTKQDKVCLPESNTVPASRCHAAGWGLTDNNDVESESDGLLVAHLPPVDTDTCQLWYSEAGIDIDFNVHKCFGYENGSQDTCRGDSGAPIVCDNNGHMEVHGISSFADECGLPQRPGVYTNVYQYKNWIIERINEIHPEANYTLATCGFLQIGVSFKIIGVLLGWFLF